MPNFYKLAVAALFVIHLFASPALSAQGEYRGSIQGTVLDEAGAPVPRATVAAYPVGTGALHSLIPEAETDEVGHFAINHLAVGRYTAIARKENAGYPNTYFSFYGEKHSAEVTLTDTNPNADIIVRLGRKAGLVSGSISKSGNGAPLNANFKLVPVASPENWMSSSVTPKYRILLPASVDVIIEATAPGFKAWKTPAPIRLGSGSEMRLDVVMEPANDPGLRASKFVIPEGYLGWLLIEYHAKGGEPAATDGDAVVYKFPTSGLLLTSSDGPIRGANDEFFFYSETGALREVPLDYRNGKAMIWGQYEGTRGGEPRQFGFFVGPEAAYKKYQNQMTHPGPVQWP